MRLGKLQLRRLLGLASPGSLLIVGDDRVSRSLVDRGLLAPKVPNDRLAFLRITPAGLRRLADALEAGELEQFMEAFPPKRQTIAEVCAEPNELVEGLPT